MTNREKYIQAFSGLHAAEDMTWESILKKDEAEGVEKKRNRRGRGNFYTDRRFLGGKTGALAACVCLVLLLAGGISAYAAGLLPSVSTIFSEIFHVSKEDEKIAKKMEKTLGISAVSGGVR